MVRRVRNRHFFVSDIALLPLAAYFSYVLRLDQFSLDRHWPSFAVIAVMMVLTTCLVFRWMGIYSRYWRYTSIDDLWLLMGAVCASSILAEVFSVVIVGLSPVLPTIPRSVAFILPLLALAATAGPRLALRLLIQYKRRSKRSDQPMKVLVMGAGDAGAQIVNDLRQNWRTSVEVVGLLDDNPSKRGIHIHGVPVLGNRYDIPSMTQQKGVHQVIIALPSIPGKVIREIVGICERTGVQTKIIPSILELLDGKVNVSKLRDVQIGDLLRRAPVQTDTTKVDELIRGKRVLVTGGGGSIGSELCRQVLRCGPRELVILGHGENSIFAIHNELLKQLATSSQVQERAVGDSPSGEANNTCRLEAVIADIRFPERIRSVFEEYRPEIVFHAAAHKHVPLMEINPVEAITNNVLGTRNVLNAALEVGVDQFVLISTDKAVNPTSIMGASKRAAELLVHHAAIATGKPYMAVRFGNVLGSRGSVVLTFQRQIAAGGPVTVTHPDMRRFFMTIPEAVQLVLQAATLGRGGEVFTLDMGEPVKIVDMARDMIELSGLEVGRDIDIVFTGMRPGEKLYEELFVPGEMYQRTVHEKIFIAHNASSFVPPQVDDLIDALERAAQQNAKAEIRYLLHTLIPQLRSPEELPPEWVPVAEPLLTRVVGAD